MTTPPSEAGELAHARAHAENRRGEPWRSRTHCEHGHPFDETNTLYRQERYGTARRCRTCKNARSAAWYERRGRALRQARRRGLDTPLVVGSD